MGSGAFGTVFHGKWKGTDVAIKRIKNSCFMLSSPQADKLVSLYNSPAFFEGTAKGLVHGQFKRYNPVSIFFKGIMLCTDVSYYYLNREIRLHIPDSILL